MIDLRTDPGLAGNRDQLVNGFEQAVALAPQVGDIATAIVGSHFGQGDEFDRIGIKRRRIDQRGRDTERAFFHGLADKLAHAVQLLGRRRPVLEANLVNAHRGGANE